MTLKLLQYQSNGPKGAAFVFEADNESEVQELLKRAAMGELLRPLTAAPPVAAASVPVPVPVPVPVAAVKAKDKPASAVGAPAKAKPAPVVNLQETHAADDESEAEVSSASASAGDDDEVPAIPGEIMAATKLREVLQHLQKMGLSTKAQMAAWCTANAPHVPVLQRIAGLEERVDRAANLLSID